MTKIFRTLKVIQKIKELKKAIEETESDNPIMKNLKNRLEIYKEAVIGIHAREIIEAQKKVEKYSDRQETK